MKKIILIAVLSFLAFNLADAKAPFIGGRVTFHTFYYSLAPYGEWIEIDYGVYAWRPVKVYIGWAPYLIGRWVWTPYGWYWDSFEPFGWAVYHYGRWFYDDYYGWIWIPDYVWGPAWVEWRYTDSYIGWAPLPPYASFSISIGIRFSINWYSPYYYWHFVPARYFCGYDVRYYVVEPKYKYRIYRESRHSIDYKYDGGRVINQGIDRNFVERKGGRVYEARVEETTRLRDFTERKTDERNRVLVYRPEEKEINKTEPIKMRRAERNISLDIDRIQTPREKLDIKTRERDLEQRQRERSNEFERNLRSREINREFDRRNEHKIDERRPDNRRDDVYRFNERDRQPVQKETSRNRNEEERKTIQPERSNPSRDLEIKREPRRSFEQPEIERQRKETRIRTDYDRTNPQMDSPQERFHKRNNNETESRSIERKRER